MELENGIVSPESSEGDKWTMPHLANNHNSTPTQLQLNHNGRGADLPRIIPAWRGGGVIGGEGRKPLQNGRFVGSGPKSNLKKHLAHGDGDSLSAV